MSELTGCNHDYCYHVYTGKAGVKCLKCENTHLRALLRDGMNAVNYLGVVELRTWEHNVRQALEGKP